MKRKLFALALAAGLVACGEGKNPPAGSGGRPPAEVDVLTIASVDAVLTQDLPGRLSAVRSAQVRARVEGVIEKQLVADGSRVPAGTPLFRIDARTYEARAHAAEADYAAARATLARYQPLLQSRAVSQQEYDGAEARLKQAEAARALAQLDLENAVPPAPISGRVGRALVTEGALVGKGEATHLITVEQLDPIRVEFTQNYSDVLRLQQAIKANKRKKVDASRVQLVLEDGSLYSETGRLHFGDLSVDPATGAVVMRAEFPNPLHELLPGTFVRVRFAQAQIAGALRVPQQAVQTTPSGQQVYAVDSEGKVQVKPIKTEGMAGADFIVSEGLTAGDQVIVNGQQKTMPGATVKPIPWTVNVPLLGAPAPASNAAPR